MLPSTAITRLDLSVSYSELSLEAVRRGFVALQVLPPLGVAKTSATYAKIALAQLLQKAEVTARAPMSTYSRDGFTWTTDTYTLLEHGVEEVTDDNAIEMYGDVLRAERIARDRAIHRVLNVLEQSVATAVEAISNTNAAGTAWTTAASADPIANIDAAKLAVRARIGMWPNALVVTRKALNAMLRTDRLEDLLKYSGQDDPKNFLPGLSTLLGLEKIIVSDTMKNTADQGQTASLASIWDDTKAVVALIKDDGLTGDIESPNPQLGRTLFLTGAGYSLPGMSMGGEDGLVVEEYREEQRRGGVIRARMWYGTELFHSACANVITGVT